MDRPKVPTANELQRVNEIQPGAAADLIKSYIDSVTRHEDRLDRELTTQLRIQAWALIYRYVSVACGSALALCSLGVCAYAIHAKADLVPVAIVLGPVAGLAGIFVWGYRPKSVEESVRQSALTRAERHLMPDRRPDRPS